MAAGEWRGKIAQRRRLRVCEEEGGFGFALSLSAGRNPGAACRSLRSVQGSPPGCGRATLHAPQVQWGLPGAGPPKARMVPRHCTGRAQRPFVRGVSGWREGVLPGLREG